MSEIPTTEQVRSWWGADEFGNPAPTEDAQPEFDTWLNAVKADAFSEGAAKQREIVEHKLGYGQTIVIPQNPYRIGGKNV